MMITRLKGTFILCLLGLLFMDSSAKQTTQTDAHLKVALRMAGHRILLNAGDSTSRVLPIDKTLAGYRLRFESSFHFEPSELAHTIDQIMTETDTSMGYIVEVEQCTSKEIVYSYEINRTKDMDLSPCAGRDLPVDCYDIVFKVLDDTDFDHPLTTVANDSPAENSKWPLIFLIFFPMLTAILAQRKRRRKQPSNGHLVAIGAFEFDTRDLSLSFQGNKIDLTSKEADLLFLFHKSTNQTLEREVILQKVWGDEGDYIGRTLDVFISKLRKKLAADPNLKIINIRGVGYRLVVQD